MEKLIEQNKYNEKDLMATQQKLQGVNQAATPGDEAASVVSWKYYSDYSDDGYQ